MGYPTGPLDNGWGRAMTCRETSNLLPLFFDGELDARQMRAVALHSTRCQTCEAELRQLEQGQDLISEQIRSAVDEIDFSNFWPAIERRLGPARVRRWTRLQVWWQEDEHPWMMRVPAFAAVAAIAVLAFLFFARAPQPTVAPEAARVAAVDNAASIDSLDTDVDSVAVLSDPETRTTVLWVSEDSGTGGEVP